MSERNWRVAVVGAGPAGLYGTEALVKRGASVDVFEKQFAPFGLVRYGVAPDHQKIKRTQAVFDRILARPEVRLFGNVVVGRDVFIEELLEFYDQVLITMGSSGARALGITGEHLAGSTSATELVNWYNGHPDFIEVAPTLWHERAVVVGMGNVAIDVARVLLRNPSELAQTDISDPALSILKESAVREVILLARRGPNQAAFDDKEVRELGALPGVEVGVAGYISRRKTPKSEFIASFPRAEKLKGPRKVILWFCASPAEIVGQERVQAVRIERNDLVESAARMKAVGTGDFSTLETGFVVRAIGYNGVPLPGVPFSSDTGTIPNAEGRVLAEPDGKVVPGLYVAGWIKRGPTGLIGTNKSCSLSTVELMEIDLGQVGPHRDDEDILRLLNERHVRVVTKEDWQRLDALEKERGQAEGRPRIKLLSLQEALGFLDGEKGVSAVHASEPTSAAG